MHLKSLTLKGFKSFASATTLRFEPGITAVVGPNGSGKSNVVDAIAWVLGEQGAKALRGGKMEDVIFAGTSGRPPLGRAEVTLTIDNTDGALPIAYAEVSITRRMFRDGASEYEINGETARLLDIQELLSDSGIGREMHVIVGQGQLDSVLSARPEDRRGFIEEAAGVLKHRKRKEKALRKLDAMQANLTRLTDLTGELRRQLKPLGKQAEVARRAAGVQAELRDSRLRLLADDLASLQDALAAEVADENAIRQRRAEVEQALGTATVTESELEQALAADAPAVAAARRRTSGWPRWPSGSGAPGRWPPSGCGIAGSSPRRSGAAGIRRSWRRRRPSYGSRSACSPSRWSRPGRPCSRRLPTGSRASVNWPTPSGRWWPRPGLRPTGGRGWPSWPARSTRCAAGPRPAATRSPGWVPPPARRGSGPAAARTELEAASGEVGELDQGELDLDSRHEAALARHAETARRVTELTEQLRAAEQERSTWSARRDALALGLTRKDGAGTLLADADPWRAGLGGRLLSVESGFEAAVAAALGAVADAVAVGVDGRGRYRAAPAEVGGRRPGRLADRWRGHDPPSAGRTSGPLPAGARWVLDVVTPRTACVPP